MGQCMAVDKTITSNNTDVGTFGQNVQKRCLESLRQPVTKRMFISINRTLPAPDSPIKAVNLPGAT